MSILKTNKKTFNGITIDYLHFDCIDSTQNFAQRINHNKIVETNWYCVIADKQTHSRGAEGIWLSFNTNLAITYAFKLHKKHMRTIQQMQFIAALSIITMLEQFYLNISFKWPNDIYANQKKIAGILTEIESNNWDNDYYNIYLGIGINVNASQNQINQITQYKATSLTIETNKKYNICKLINYLSEKITYHTTSNIMNISYNIINLMRSNLEKFNNQFIKVKYKQNNITQYESVKIIDITDDGHLVLLKADNTKLHLSNCKIIPPKV